MRRFLWTSGAVAALAMSPVLAAEFADWDADDNSFVDRGEFEVGYDEADLFEGFDTDQDAYLNTEEIAGVSYPAMDLDGDGEVTVSEWDTWVDRRTGEAGVNLSVAEWDENGDNIISRMEFDEQVAERGWFTAFGEAGEDEVYDQDEFETGLFDNFDTDDDERLGEEEFLIDNFGI